MKKCIYSPLIGNYDDLPEHPVLLPGWDYILFTDNEEHKHRPSHWDVRMIDPNIIQPYLTKTPPKLLNRLIARFIKINAHILLPDYNYVLFMDSNVLIRNNNYIGEVLEEHISNNISWGLLDHPCHHGYVYGVLSSIKNPLRNNILKRTKIQSPNKWYYTVDNELTIIQEWGLEPKYRVKKARKFLESQNFPMNYEVIFETNMILRKNKDQGVQKICQEWWDLVFNVCSRDQWALVYLHYKYRFPYEILLGKDYLNSFNHIDLQRKGHARIVRY